MIKASSLASTVTLLEVTGMARRMVSETFAPYEIFVVAGLIYLLLTSIAVKATRLLEVHLSSERRPKRRALRIHPAHAP